MADEGPELERLVHRLSECPEDMLAEPAHGAKAGVRVDAVVHDLILDLGGEPPGPADVSPFSGAGAKPAARRWLRLVLVACWLLHHEGFRSRRGLARPALAWLRDGLGELSALVDADLFVRDADRREELARLCLKALGLRPAGETPAQAEDRLRTLGTVERHRVVEATRAAEEHARKLREQLRAKKAQEAAARASGEW